MSPKVFLARAQLRRAIGPVGKDSRNSHQGWKFRGIDHLQAAFIEAVNKLESVDVEVSYELIEAKEQAKGYSVWVRGTMVLTSLDDGSACSWTAIGQGTDPGDKATNKAESAALKYLIGHGLGVPVIGLSDDSDQDSPVATRRS